MADEINKTQDSDPEQTPKQQSEKKPQRYFKKKHSTEIDIPQQEVAKPLGIIAHEVQAVIDRVKRRTLTRQYKPAAVEGSQKPANSPTATEVDEKPPKMTR